MTVNDSTIVVNVKNTNVIVIGSPGGFLIQCEDTQITAQIRKNLVSITETPLIPGMGWVLFPTGQETFLEILASVVAVDPGTAIVVEAPKEVLDVLREKAGVTNPGAIY